MRQVTNNVYQFTELTDSAKETARQWFREASAGDSYYSECVIEDAKECLALAGFRVDTVYFSGFSSQGDGACFEGAWYPKDCLPVKAMKAHAPKDTELHRIAATMRAIAKRDKNSGMTVKHRGHYYHEHCTEFGIDARTLEIEEEIIEASRDAMRWIYRQLEREWDYQNSDENVDETIQANEYEFTEEGKRCIRI